MREHPIIFSTDMAKAILEGRKTQTRRVIKKAIHEFKSSKGLFREIAGAVLPAMESGWIAWYPGNSEGLAEFTKQQYKKGFPCPYGQVGDRLWVRETWYYYGGDEYMYQQNPKDVLYKSGHIADPETGMVFIPKWRPSIFMPRWASRITLEITEVRVERVQEITEEDAIKEGISPEEHPFDAPPAMRFAILWDSINAKRGYSWESNCWVWVLSFRRLNNA